MTAPTTSVLLFLEDFNFLSAFTHTYKSTTPDCDFHEGGGS